MHVLCVLLSGVLSDYYYMFMCFVTKHKAYNNFHRTQPSINHIKQRLLYVLCVLLSVVLCDYYVFCVFWYRLCYANSVCFLCFVEGCILFNYYYIFYVFY